MRSEHFCRRADGLSGTRAGRYPDADAGPGAGTIVAMAVTADVRIPMRPLTVSDYERMFDVGILTEGDSVELLKGQLSEVSPQGPQHAATIQWLAAQLIRGIDPDVAAVRVQLPLRFVPVSEPEPDIAIVPVGTYSHEHPAEAMLVIEVAATSQQLDLGAKAEVYATAGVIEYWVIDLPARTVHVHRSPVGAAYRSGQQIASGRVRLPLRDASAIRVDTLFGLLD
jgi:Uma2 family endonuclease